MTLQESVSLTLSKDGMSASRTSTISLRPKHSSTPPSPPTKPFPLLALPTELWLLIGTFAVSYSTAISINHHKKCAREHHGCTRCRSTRCKGCTYLPEQPALTRVNRALRTELLPLFYQLNDFHSCNWENAETLAWLKAIGPHARSWLGEVLVSSAASNWCGFKGYQSLPHADRELFTSHGQVVRKVPQEEVAGLVCCSGQTDALYVVGLKDEGGYVEMLGLHSCAAVGSSWDRCSLKDSKRKKTYMGRPVYGLID